jgi:beta-lactamase regulating signal transducer with metallopeptidase domain
MVMLGGGCRIALEIGISVLIQSSLLLMVGLAAGDVLRRRGPVLQSLVFRATLAAVVLGALLSFCCAGSLPSLWSISLPAPGGAETGPFTRESRGTVPGIRNGVSGRPAATAVRGAASERLRLATNPVAAAHASLASTGGWLYAAAISAWGMGSFLLLAWLVFCQLHLRRLRAQSTPVHEATTVACLQELCQALGLRPPLLRASPAVRAPLLMGVRRPAILLPASHTTDFDGQALRAILAHELHHLPRRDCAWYLLARITCALGWVQPLLWVLCRRLEQASEEACDQAVIQQHCSPRAYADCLLTLAERLAPSRRERAAGAGVVPIRSALGRRIQGILSIPPRRTRPPSVRTRAAIALGASCSVGLGFLLVSTPPVPGRERLLGGMAMAQPIDEGAVILGRVVDEDGRPVAGVHLAAATRARMAILGRRSTFAQGTTQADGSFRVTGLATETYFVYLTANGADRVAAAVEGVAVKEGESVRVPDLVLTPGALITGTVVDQETGRPLEGVHVGCYGPHRPRFSGVLDSVRTDRDGRYRLRVAPGTNHVYVAAAVQAEDPAAPSDPSHQVYAAEVALAKGETKRVSFRVNGKLIAPAVVVGRVVYENGEAAKGVRVVAGIQHSVRTPGLLEKQRIGYRMDWADDRTGPDGSYRLIGLGTARYNVTVDRSTPEWVAAAAEGVAARDGETVRAADLVLTRGAFITGTVVDKRTGQPLQGVSIGCHGPQRPRSSGAIDYTATDRIGRFTLRVAPGSCWVYVNGPARLGRWPEWMGREGIDVVVAKGQTQTVQFRIDPRDLDLAANRAGRAPDRQMR